MALEIKMYGEPQDFIDLLNKLFWAWIAAGAQSRENKGAAKEEDNVD